MNPIGQSATLLNIENRIADLEKEQFEINLAHLDAVEDYMNDYCQQHLYGEFGLLEKIFPILENRKEPSEQTHQGLCGRIEKLRDVCGERWIEPSKNTIKKSNDLMHELEGYIQDLKERIKAAQQNENNSFSPSVQQIEVEKCIKVFKRLVNHMKWNKDFESNLPKLAEIRTILLEEKKFQPSDSRIPELLRDISVALFQLERAATRQMKSDKSDSQILWKAIDYQEEYKKRLKILKVEDTFYFHLQMCFGIQYGYRQIKQALLPKDSISDEKKGD